MPQRPNPIGLCLTCTWARRVQSGRGSTFWRCGRSDADSRFPRYPPLPVVACAGFEERAEDSGGS